MTDDMKKFLTILLTGIAAAIAAALLYLSPASSPQPSPSPSPTIAPTSTPAPKTAFNFISTGEKPEHATASDFFPSDSKLIAQGEVAFTIGKSDSPCDLASQSIQGLSFKSLQPINIVHPSYDGAPTGNAYDIVVPLDSCSCKTSPYVLIEIRKSGTYSIQGATLTVTDSPSKFDAYPKVPLIAGLHQSYLQYGYFGKYGGSEEKLAYLWLNWMKDMRLNTYDSMVLYPPVTTTGLDFSYGGNISYQNLVSAFNPKPVPLFIPNKQEDASYYQALEKTIQAQSLKGQAYVYAWDEPAQSEMSSLINRLNVIKLNSPSARRMVTVEKRTGLDGLVDIYVPNYDVFYSQGAKESDYTGAELWLYGSCMSHGCSYDTGNQFGIYNYVAGTSSGTPDLVIDRPAAHAIAYQMVPAIYKTVKAQLYYSVNEIERFGALFRSIDNTWANGGNGDGQLAYSLRSNEKCNGAEPGIASSLRAYYLREGSYLSDLYFVKRAISQSKADTALASCMTDLKTFSKQVSCFRTMRKALEGI